MKTTFSAAQLAHPALAEANKILRNCVHCGFCTATCPTYVLMGDELDSPRGRIYLIKDMLENGRAATADVVKHVDRCLSCLACMTTCPSGVDYMHLVDHARVHIEQTYARPWTERLLRQVLAWVLPYPSRMRVSLRLAALARPLAALLPVSNHAMTAPTLFDRLRAMLLLAPKRLPPAHPLSPPAAAATVRQGRVILLQGCAQTVLAPQFNAAAQRLLTRLGFDVVLAPDEGCCGALVHHMGREQDAAMAARANIDSWRRVGGPDGIDAVVITASGCGTMVKDYGSLLRDDRDYADAAAGFATKACDITEFVARCALPLAQAPRPLVVAYHAACSLQHGQKITREPKELLSKFGFVVKDINEAHLCCGSAGTYNILQPDIARRLRERKVANIAALKPDVIAAGNIGCVVQIASGTSIPVVHTVELLDWATGGPAPAMMKPDS